MTIPHYKIVEIGGKNLVVFYPQFKDEDGYKIIDLENRFPIELKNEEEYKMFLEAIITSEDLIKDGLKTLADLVDEMSLLAKGPKGDTRFMWVKYADDDKGSGMSDNPDGKKYIGMAFNKDVEKPSNNASDYKWVKYVADYEGLEIGGRNLIQGTYEMDESAFYQDGDIERRTDEDIPYIISTGTLSDFNTVLLQPNSEYTLSVDIRNWRDSPSKSPILLQWFDSYNGSRVSFKWSEITPQEITDDWIRYTVNFKTTSDNLWFSLGVRHAEFRLIKLEKGTVATDWSPAPEDFYELIDNVDKAHVGLSNVQNYGIASQSQAENGTSNNAYMTPLRTKQAIDHQRPTIIERKSGSTPADDFPPGISFMDIDGGGTSDGYPQNYGTVITYKSANNRISQEFVGNGFNSGQEVKFTRHYHPNNSFGGWTEWQESVFVLSHSVGNDYGCIKYSNGMMECWARVELTRQANARMGGYWTFDYKFTDNPNITFSIDYTDASITPSVFALGALYIRSLNNETAEFAVGRMSGETNFEDGDIMHVFAKATGRWD